MLVTMFDMHSNSCTGSTTFHHVHSSFLPPPPNTRVYARTPARTPHTRSVVPFVLGWLDRNFKGIKGRHHGWWPPLVGRKYTPLPLGRHTKKGAWRFLGVKNYKLNRSVKLQRRNLIRFLILAMAWSPVNWLIHFSSHFEVLNSTLFMLNLLKSYSRSLWWTLCQVFLLCGRKWRSMTLLARFV
jgi:hypothetical protein